MTNNKILIELEIPLIEKKYDQEKIIIIIKTGKKFFQIYKNKKNLVLVLIKTTVPNIIIKKTKTAHIV